MPVERNLADQPGRWSFDGEVADEFDEMLDRSIPQLEVMRAAAADLVCSHAAANPSATVVDLGCSRGGAIAAYRPRLPAAARVVGLEVSEPMLDAATARFADDSQVTIRRHDLRQRLPADLGPCSAVTAVLTVQFVPIEHRLRLLADCRRVLAPGGCLIMVEKVLGASASLDDTMVDLYYRRKRDAGYTQVQIDRKRLALEGVLVPVTARWNEELLRTAGFSQVDAFWRWMNFAGWVALA